MKKKVFLSVAVVLLVVMVAAMLVACTPSVSSVDKKYKKAEYEGGAVTIDGHSAANYTKGLNNVTIIWFDSEDDAKEYAEVQTKILGEKRVSRKGKAVATGTTDAVAIF